MKSTFLTALGLLWLGGVVYLLFVAPGFGIFIASPKWLPHGAAVVLTVAVSVIALLGWIIPLGAGLSGIAKRD